MIKTSYLLVLLLIVSFMSSCLPSPQLSPLGEHIDQLVAQAAEEGHFAGVVLVATSDGVLIEHAYPAPTAQQITVETPFPIASVTKLFTAVLILQLADQDLLALDMPIGTYLPDYPRPAADEITIYHLLTFRSGLPNYEQQTANPIDAYLQPHTLEKFVERYLSEPPKAAAGSRFNYTNGDYILLTQIIETVTGMPWSTVLHKQILDPLKMTQSGVIGVDNPGIALARGNFVKDGQLQPDPAYHPENYFGAGAMYATAGDLLKFARGLDDETLLSAQSRTRMLTPDPEFGWVALGSWVYDVPTADGLAAASEIRGATWGIGSLLQRVPRTGQTIILLEHHRNLDRQSLETLAQAINALISETQ